MQIEQWVAEHGRIAHREDLLRAGFGRDLGRLVRVNRAWFRLPDAPVALVAAARLGGRITCVTAAKHRGLALLRPPATGHFWVPEHANAQGAGLRLHRRRPLAPVPRHALVQATPDVLQHVADCLPHEEALVVWESAVRSGVVSVAQLRRLPWRGAARRVMAECGDRSDSLLETLVATRLRAAGIPFVQQARLLGHRVDFLVADRLVVQTDGFAFHRDARQREEDLRHDARLLLEGTPVMRCSYRDVVDEWDASFQRIQTFLAQTRAPAGRGRAA